MTIVFLTISNGPLVHRLRVLEQDALVNSDRQ